MRRNSVKPYKWLARYYDRVFTFHHRAGETARKHLLAGILPGVETACDLACGTGTTALRLAKSGIRVIGVDLSADMCRVARAKAQASRLPVEILSGDMRSFRLPQKVDLVLCEFDALNHVPRKSDLSRVARAVARALKPGGYFYFDVNNRLGFQTYWKGSFCIEKPGLMLVMNSGNRASQDRAWSDCHWFVRNGPHWHRYQERVEEVCWSAAEVRATLRNAGFSMVRTVDSARFFNLPHITSGCRTHYLARKSSAALSEAGTQ